MSEFGLSELQANAILEMRLRALTGLERKRLQNEYDDLMERIGELRAILSDESRIDGVIREELLEVKATYGRRDERRTEIIAAEGDLELEDLIAEEDMVIAITRSGYIKRLSPTAYREQRRGGVGVMGMDMKDEDYIEHLFVASTHDYILFFTSVGKVYRLKVHELPLGSRQAKGRMIGNLLPVRQDEQVRAVIKTRNFEETEYLLCATKNGVVKKTKLADYNTPLKADGIIAIKMRDADELVSVRLCSTGDDVLLVSRKGQAIRFSEADARAMGRATEGVRGMTLRGDDVVITAEIANDDSDLLVVTENGFGKRTRVSEYPRKGRGGMGVQTVKLTEARGYLAGALVVRDGYQVMLISTGGTVIKMPVEDVKRLGRSTQGVIVMRLRDARDRLVARPGRRIGRGCRGRLRGVGGRRDDPGRRWRALPPEAQDEPSEEDDRSGRRRALFRVAAFNSPFRKARVGVAGGWSTGRGSKCSTERGRSRSSRSISRPISTGSSSISARCAVSPASRRCSSTTGRTRRRSRRRARSSGSTTSSRSSS